MDPGLLVFGLDAAYAVKHACMPLDLLKVQVCFGKLFSDS